MTACNLQKYFSFKKTVETRWYLQYRLEECVSHRRTRQVTQLFAYLLTHKLFSSCIRRYIVSRACDWVMQALSAVLLTFSFQFSLLFFHVESQAAAAAYVIYPISDIGRCRKCGKYVPCIMRRTAQGKEFELILRVKMETRYPVDGYFGSEFRAICNHCGVMMAWSCKTWKFCEQFLLFLGKRIPYVKFFRNSVPKVFTASTIDVVLFKYCKMLPMGNPRNHALFTGEKISAVSQTVATARIALKICPNNVLTVLQISSKSVHFRWSYSRMREHRFFGPVEYFHCRLLEPIITSCGRFLIHI